MSKESVLEKAIDLVTLILRRSDNSLDVGASFRELLTSQKALKEAHNTLMTEYEDLKANNDALLTQNMAYQDAAEASRHQVIDMQCKIEELEKSRDQYLAESADWHEKFLRLEYRAKEMQKEIDEYKKACRPLIADGFTATESQENSAL